MTVAISPWYIPEGQQEAQCFYCRRVFIPTAMGIQHQHDPSCEWLMSWRRGEVPVNQTESAWMSALASKEGRQLLNEEVVDKPV